MVDQVWVLLAWHGKQVSNNIRCVQRVNPSKSSDCVHGMLREPWRQCVFLQGCERVYLGLCSVRFSVGTNLDSGIACDAVTME
jgi:hypothetical protein